MSNKAKLSNIVQRQFPEHIRENYPGLVEFVKLYYEFLQDSQVQDLEKIRDIDTSLDEFIDSFKSELAKNVPIDKATDKRLLLKNIRDFYLSRGSEESYKFLFRTLFSKEAELFYPSTQILRASDGKWIQDVSIFLKVTGTTTTLFPIEGVFIAITTPTKSITTYVSSVVEYSNDIFEVFIEREYQNFITVGSTITYSIGQTTYTGIVLPCPTKVSIFNPGSGFKVGDIFSLKTSLGRGCTIKVTKVDSNGGIRAIQLVRFGLDYVSTFYSYLSSAKDIAYEYVHPAKLNHPTGNWSPTYTDPVDGMANYGYASRQTYFYVDNQIPVADASYTADRLYADGTYVGEIVGSFFDEATPKSEENLAIIQVDLGAVAKYPGYYSTSDGFVSDEMYIHDGEYYQAFSYVIKVEEELRKYSDIVKALVHPAGMKLFAEYNITNIINVAARSVLVQSVLQLPEDGTDLITVTDRGQTYSSYDTTYSQELNDWVLSPSAGASIVYSAQGKASLLMAKVASSIASAVTLEIQKSIGKNVDSSQSLQELISKEFTKSVSSVISDIASTLISKELTRLAESNLDMSNASSVSLLMNKVVSITQTIADDVSKDIVSNVSSNLTSLISQAILNPILNKNSAVTTTSGISSLSMILGKDSSAIPTSAHSLNPILNKASSASTTSGISSLSMILGKNSPVIQIDQIASTFTKPLGSSVTINDVLSKFLPVLNFSSSNITFTDNALVSKTQILDPDTISILDSIFKESITNVLDSAFATDADFVRNISKSINSPVTNTELIEKNFQLGTISDTVSLSDIASLLRFLDFIDSLAPADSSSNNYAKNVSLTQSLGESFNNAFTSNLSDPAFTQGGNLFDGNGNPTIISMLKTIAKPLSETLFNPQYDTTPATRADNITFFSDTGSNLIALDGNSTQDFTGYGLYVPRRQYNTGNSSTPLGALNTPTFSNGNTYTNFLGQTVVLDYIASQVIENIVTAYKPKSATYTVSMTSSRTAAGSPLGGSVQYYRHISDSIGTRTFTFANSSDVTNLNAAVGDYLWCSGFAGGDLVSNPPETSNDQTYYYYILNGYGWKITAIDVVAKTVTCSALFTFDRYNSNNIVGPTSGTGQVYRMTSLQLQTNALAQGRGNTFDGSYSTVIFGFPSSVETWTLIDYMTLMPVAMPDILSNNLAKPFSSGATSSDSNSLVTNPNFAEAIAQSDTNTFTTEKSLTETINTIMAGAISLNPYAAEEYGTAAELYSPGTLLD
jgi:hypothetical protein